MGEFVFFLRARLCAKQESRFEAVDRVSHLNLQRSLWPSTEAAQQANIDLRPERSNAARGHLRECSVGKKLG
jgi:hypothetical protein